MIINANIGVKMKARSNSDGIDHIAINLLLSTQ